MDPRHRNGCLLGRGFSDPAGRMFGASDDSMLVRGGDPNNGRKRRHDQVVRRSGIRPGNRVTDGGTLPPRSGGMTQVQDRRQGCQQKKQAGGPNEGTLASNRANTGRPSRSRNTRDGHRQTQRGSAEGVRKLPGRSVAPLRLLFQGPVQDLPDSGRHLRQCGRLLMSHLIQDTEMFSSTKGGRPASISQSVTPSALGP